MVELTGVRAVLEGVVVFSIGALLFAFRHTLDRWDEQRWRRISPGDGAYTQVLMGRVARWIITGVAVFLGAFAIVRGCINLLR